MLSGAVIFVLKKPCVVSRITIEEDDTMATARKLPSGSWRCQVFSHYETITDKDGREKKKRVYESFTASTKKEAERQAAVWAADQEAARPENITIYEAVSRYIAVKETVLSPSTIAGYRRMQKNCLGEIASYNLRKLNSTIVQTWISSLSSYLSPKSVRNAYALLSATFDMFAPDIRLKITLPARKKPELYTPSDDDIQKLLDHIKGTELEIAVLLAAFGPMRRGEICALKDIDISGRIVTVNKSLVLGSDKTWHLKQPKTYSGYRQIEYPQFVIDRIADINGRIVKGTPDQISNRFRRAVHFSGLPHFRFHDLRHYAASIMHAIGVPDQYIMARGGWKSDSVMKAVYRNVIDLEAARQNDKINKHFENMQHEMQHEKSEMA
jgi:integrase